MRSPNCCSSLHAVVVRYLVMLVGVMSAVAAPPWNLGALDRLSYEEKVHEILRSPSIAEMDLIGAIRLYQSATARGNSDIKKATFENARAMLTAPDIADRHTLEDGIALLAYANRETLKTGIRNLAAEAVRKIASQYDDRELTDAFLAATPVAASPGDGASRGRRQLLFWLISDRWIEKQIRELSARTTDQMRCPPFDGDVPKAIRDMHGDALEAWKEGKRFSEWRNKFPPAFQLDQGARPQKVEWVTIGSPRFEAAINRFFQDPASVSRNTMLMFVRHDDCIDFSEFEAVKNRVLMMMDLRDGLTASAISMMLSDEPYLIQNWTVTPDWRDALLRLAGLDPEKLFTSFLFDPIDRPPGLPRVESPEIMLAARGSTSGARVLLEVEKLGITRPRFQGGDKSIPKQGPLRADVISQFLAPPDVQDAVRPAIDPALEHDLIRLLTDDLRQMTDYSSLANRLAGLARIQRRELAVFIRPYLESPYDRVVQSASSALRGLGEQTPEHKSRADAKFQFNLNGQPWVPQNGMFAWMSDHGISGTFERNELTFCHDDMVRVESKYGATVRLVVRPSPNSGSNISYPWFAVSIPLPVRFDAVNEIKVATCPLSVRVRHPRSLTKLSSRSCVAELLWLDEPSKAWAASEGRFLIENAGDFTFAALQPGRYQLKITAAGAAPWSSEVIEVKPGMEPVTASLQTGVDIRAQIILPNFRKKDRLPGIAGILDPSPEIRPIPFVEIRDAGKALDGANAIYDPGNGSLSIKNVPVGKYALHVFGSKELAKNSYDLATEDGSKATSGWAGMDLAVEVREDSPEKIDLGKIRMKRIDL